MGGGKARRSGFTKERNKDSKMQKKREKMYFLAKIFAGMKKKQYLCTLFRLKGSTVAVSDRDVNAIRTEKQD